MTRIRIAEVSMQFSDRPAAIRHDAVVIFKQGYRVIMGTEASPSGHVRGFLREEAHKAGYRIHFGAGDSWVAVNKKFIKGKWSAGYVSVIKKNEGVGPHNDRGISWVKFKSTTGRTFLVGAGHYLTKGRSPRDPNYTLNHRFRAALIKWANNEGHNAGVIIYGGDQNKDDQHHDTFFGAPFTSAWDELKKWESTGGNKTIDVIASYDKSKAVEWISVDAVRDNKLNLHTDHFVVEAVANITERRRRRGTPTTRVVRNLRRRGRKVYGHKACLIFSSVYRTRRRTRPHHIIWNGDHDAKDDRVDTLWAHISVTHAFKISIRSCMRTLHRIGMERFGSGISYNFAVHHRTGQIGVGQFLDAKGTHTVMRVPRAGYSYDQNAVSLAIVFIGMPGMVVSDKAWESYEHLIAALIDEGYLTHDFDHNPHSFADPNKDCPTQIVRDHLQLLKLRGVEKAK